MQFMFVRKAAWASRSSSSSALTSLRRAWYKRAAPIRSRFGRMGASFGDTKPSQPWGVGVAVVQPWGAADLVKPPWGGADDMLRPWGGGFGAVCIVSTVAVSGCCTSAGPRRTTGTGGMSTRIVSDAVAVVCCVGAAGRVVPGKFSPSSSPSVFILLRRAVGGVVRLQISRCCCALRVPRFYAEDGVAVRVPVVIQISNIEK